MADKWLDDATSDRVTKLVHQRIGPIKQVVDPTPLAGALQIAAAEVLAMHSRARLDEEEITLSLLGALAIAIPSMAESFPDSFTPTFQWQRYSKSGRGHGGEGASGADFALLIRLSDKYARAAIFQAKKEKEKTHHSVEITSISPYRPNGAKDPHFPEPQILRLIRNARTLTHDQTIDLLSWVHFLSYGVDGCLCIPVSDHAQTVIELEKFQVAVNEELTTLKASLETERRKEQERAAAQEAGHAAASVSSQKLIASDHPCAPNTSSEAVPKRRISDEIANELKLASASRWKVFSNRRIASSINSVEFIHFLAAGASAPPGSAVKGWLELEGDAIAKFTSNAANAIPLVKASVSKDLDLENNFDGADRTVRLAACARVVERLNNALPRPTQVLSPTDSAKDVSQVASDSAPPSAFKVK